MSALLFEDKLWLNLFFAVEWAVRLAMIVVVPMRRSPDAAKGWLLLIFFEPTVGRRCRSGASSVTSSSRP